MQSFRNISLSAFRWVWLAALVFFAFAFLVNGLSGPDQRAPDPVEATVATATVGAISDAVPEDLREVIWSFNRAREGRLSDQGLSSADSADWLTVCRRMSLALVGTGMSMEEIRSLQRLPVEDREVRHLNRLLRDPRFHEYWGERYTRFLVGADEGPFLVFRRRRFRLWLTEQFAQNQHYDQIVRDLITAEGLWTDQPEVNFYTVTYDSGDDGPDPIRLAARTARVFLGLRIDCLQCHDDFLGNVSLGDIDDPRDGLQSDFHQLAAFFTAAKASGLQGVTSGQPDYRYKYLYADEEVDVEPAVPYQSDLLPDQGHARHRLARWITSPDNRQAARSAVHHVWALLFGRPRGDGVDSLPLDEPIDDELAILIDDFIDKGFDMRRLIRAIVLSDAFRVDSRADFHITARHDRAGAVFPLVRLRPEQIAGAVIQSSRVKTVDRDSSFFLQLQKFGSANDFVRRYGDMGEDEFTNDSVTISQRLVMLNGKMVDESVDYNPVLNATSHVKMFSGDDWDLIRNAYLCVLNRYPSSTELNHFVGRFEESKNPNQMTEDLFWVLLNSSEFCWNH